MHVKKVCLSRMESWTHVEIRHRKSNELRQSTINDEMKWKDLIEEVMAVGAGGDSGQPITGVEYDSRRVRPGSVFVAMKGGSTDGNRYVDKAIAASALGIITDSAPAFDHLLVFQPGLPVLEVEHGRRALAQASAALRLQKTWQKPRLMSC